MPHYGGFTIDSLARLCVLDDITVASSGSISSEGLSHSEGEGQGAGLGGIVEAPQPNLLLGARVLFVTQLG